MIKGWAIRGVALTALLSASGSAIGKDAAAIDARLRVLEAEIAKLRKEAHEAKAQAAVAASKATNVANAAQAHLGKDGHGHAPPPVFVSFKNGLFVETEDKAYAFKVGGRIQIDGGGVTNPIGLPPNMGYTGYTSFRRVRLEVEGKAAKIWFYKLQYDFTGGALGGIRDAFIGLQHPAIQLPYSTEPVWFQVGSIYEPFGLDAVTSSKFTDFVERPMSIDGFAPFRHVGATVATHGDKWTAKAGIFSTSFEDNNFNPGNINAPASWWAPVARGGGQYFDLTGRLTYAPIKTEHDLIHLGVAGRYHQPNDATGAGDDRMLRVGNRLRSEANVLNMQTLGTPDLSCSTTTTLGVTTAATSTLGLPGVAMFPAQTGLSGKCANSEFQYGFELAAAYGPFSMQAEYIGMQVNRDPNKMLQAQLLGQFAPGGSSAFFNGFYGYGEWYVTGEERAEAYSVKDKNGASFEQVQIKNPLSKGGLGAIGLLARYSSINLNSGRWSGSGLNNMLAYTSFVQQSVANTQLLANQAGVVGGNQQNVTVGANWYPDDGFHFQLNWTHVLHWSAPLQGVGATNAANQFLVLQNNYHNQSHPDLFEARAQIYW